MLHSIIGFFSALIPALPVMPRLNYRFDSLDEDFELSSPHFLLVAKLLEDELTNAERESFVNDYAWVASAEDFEKDIETEEDQALYYFDAVLVDTPRFSGAVVGDENFDELRAAMREVQDTFFVPNAAVISLAMKLDHEAETAAILESFELL